MNFEADHSLSKAEILRYSRQLILEDFGQKGQQNLKESSVLIVGAGGLGCPVAIYLAAGGVGKLGIVDYDVVEMDNLHRQVLHTENRVGTSKAQSIKESVRNINSSVECISFECQLTNANASSIISQFDIIADCTDNVVTRYLLNDACILNNKPLVSGSALRWEGQLTVYNYGKDCPCYRCIYPTPPPSETVTNCSEGGVIGPVVGVIGSLQALEIMKIAAKVGSTYAQRLFVFDGFTCQTRTVKLRPKNDECAVCGSCPTVTELIDYETFCWATACDKIMTNKRLKRADRISVDEFSKLRKENTNHILIDVRPKHEFEICHLTHSINIPLVSIEKEEWVILDEKLNTNKDKNTQVYVICHRGNDSQDAVVELRKKYNLEIKDIIGGLQSWAEKIDCDFPKY